MPDSARTSKREQAPPVFAPYVVEAQRRYAELAGRAMEVMTGAARALWQSEMEFWRLGTAQAPGFAIPRGTGKDAAASMSGYLEQWQKNLDAMIEHLGTTSRLFRQYGWDLYNVCEDGLREAAKPVRAEQDKA